MALTGLLAVLAVAVVLTAVAVTQHHILDSARTRESDTCQLDADHLREALAKICDSGNSRLLLAVKYGQNALSCGQTATKEETSSKPGVKMNNVERDARYTLLMLDPDAPGHSLDSLTFWLHWAVTDIKGIALDKGFVEGNNLMDYAGPTPPKGSGNHRYQIIVFESTNSEGVQLPSNGRGQFSLANFVQMNNLCNIVGLFQFVVPAKT